MALIPSFWKTIFDQSAILDIKEFPYDLSAISEIVQQRGAGAGRRIILWRAPGKKTGENSELWSFEAIIEQGETGTEVHHMYTERGSPSIDWSFSRKEPVCLPAMNKSGIWERKYNVNLFSLFPRQDSWTYLIPFKSCKDEWHPIDGSPIIASEDVEEQDDEISKFCRLIKVNHLRERRSVPVHAVLIIPAALFRIRNECASRRFSLI